MTLKVACVGAGYFSQFHYDSWARIDRVNIVGACDTDIVKANATGHRAFDDLAVMLAKTEPDVLDVILPPNAQADAIRVAIAAGIKTVICQKPFCEGISEAEVIVAAAEAAGTRIIIHENFRFQPWFRTIKHQIDAGAVGVVQQVTFRLRPGDGQGPNAYMERQPYFQKMAKLLIHETGVHYVDTFRFLLGEPTAIYADLRTLNPVIAGEDAGLVLFDHAGGARALLDGNRHLDHAAENLRCTMGEGLVEGTEGTLGLTGDGAVHLRKHGAIEMTEVLAPTNTGGFGGDCVHHLQSHIVSGVLDGTKIENEARSYLQVLRIEDVIYRSASAGQKIKV